MNASVRLVIAALFLGGVAARAGEVSFSAKPSVAKDGDKVKISFAVSAATDVEVAVLAADGKMVRHLAAGVLGGPQPTTWASPPAAAPSRCGSAPAPA
jgi:hypothetical protein